VMWHVKMDLTCQSCGHHGTLEYWECIGCQSGSDSWVLQTIHQSHASEAGNAAGDPNAYNVQIIYYAENNFTQLFHKFYVSVKYFVTSSLCL